MSRALVLALLALVLARPAAGADETEAALEALASPAERVRTDAVERLVDLLPASRARVIAALDGAEPAVRLHLVEVLARDASPEAVRAMLATLRRADGLLAARIQRFLARDAEATRAVLATWNADPATRLGADGKPDARMETLARLLRRAEAEGVFLSRKSKTGSTGSYHGQYAVLESYREEAVELCVDILLDRPPEIPGVVRVGKFEFLRETDVNWDIDEIQSMAAHAFGELALPTDHRALLPLHGLLRRARIEFDALEQGQRWELSRIKREQELLRALGLYTDLLIALYRVNPTFYARQVDAFIAELPYTEALDLAPSTLPMLLLRVGRYEDAVATYRRLLLLGGGLYSRALAYYNLACAYAQWGLQVEGRLRAQCYDEALDNLRHAVAYQWSDVGWLDEDRDLDPIRDRREFAQIRREMLRAITPPDDR